MAVRTRDTPPVSRIILSLSSKSLLASSAVSPIADAVTLFFKARMLATKLSFAISLDDSVNTVLWCTGLLTSFAHDLPEGSRTWIPPIHHFSIPLAKLGSRKKPFWDVRNGCFWILLQDKSNSVVAVRHNPTPALHLTNLNGGCIGVFFMTKAARQRAHELR
jgi:hypothetical protein